MLSSENLTVSFRPPRAASLVLLQWPLGSQFRVQVCIGSSPAVPILNLSLKQNCPQEHSVVNDVICFVFLLKRKEHHLPWLKKKKSIKLLFTSLSIQPKKGAESPKQSGTESKLATLDLSVDQVQFSWCSSREKRKQRTFYIEFAFLHESLWWSYSCLADTIFWLYLSFCPLLYFWKQSTLLSSILRDSWNVWDNTGDLGASWLVQW